MIIRFNQDRRLYIQGGGSGMHTRSVVRDEDLEVAIHPSIHGTNQVDIYFTDGAVAYGCLTEWYVEVVGGVVTNRLAYKSPMDKLPLP